MTGKITSLGNGFGTVSGPDGKEIFFHVSALKQANFSDLKVGDTVEVEIDANSLQATSVRPIP